MNTCAPRLLSHIIIIVECEVKNRPLQLIEGNGFLEIFFAFGRASKTNLLNMLQTLAASVLHRSSFL